MKTNLQYAAGLQKTRPPLVRQSILDLLAKNPSGLTARQISKALNIPASVPLKVISMSRFRHGTEFFRVAGIAPATKETRNASAIYVQGPGKDLMPIKHIRTIKCESVKPQGIRNAFGALVG